MKNALTIFFLLLLTGCTRSNVGVDFTSKISAGIDKEGDPYLSVSSIDQQQQSAFTAMSQPMVQYSPVMMVPHQVIMPQQVMVQTPVPVQTYQQQPVMIYSPPASPRPQSQCNGNCAQPRVYIENSPNYPVQEKEESVKKKSSSFSSEKLRPRSHSFGSTPSVHSSQKVKPVPARSVTPMFADSAAKKKEGLRFFESYAHSKQKAAHAPWEGQEGNRSHLLRSNKRSLAPERRVVPPSQNSPSFGNPFALSDARDTLLQHHSIAKTRSHSFNYPSHAPSIPYVSGFTGLPAASVPLASAPLQGSSESRRGLPNNDLSGLFKSKMPTKSQIIKEKHLSGD